MGYSQPSFFHRHSIIKPWLAGVPDISGAVTRRSNLVTEVEFRHKQSSARSNRKHFAFFYGADCARGISRQFNAGSGQSKSSRVDFNIGFAWQGTRQSKCRSSE